MLVGTGEQSSDGSVYVAFVNHIGDDTMSYYNAPMATFKREPQGFGCLMTMQPSGIITFDDFTYKWVTGCDSYFTSISMSFTEVTSVK